MSSPTNFSSKAEELEPIAEPVNEEDNTEEIPQATEEEQRDFDKYMRVYKKQEQVVDSYEKLLEQKEREEKKRRIKGLNNKVGNKIMNLECSHGRDRLGLDAEFYKYIWELITTDVLFDGDIIKQYRLLEILASQEYEIKNPREVRIELEKEFRELL